jgi:hypothetical protein
VCVGVWALVCVYDVCVTVIVRPIGLLPILKHLVPLQQHNSCAYLERDVVVIELIVA